MKKSTARTSDTSRKYINVFDAWLDSHAAARKQHRRPVTSPGRDQYMGFLWPVSRDYASPLNPFFLIDCPFPEFLETRPIWMVRDGLVPLLWFLRNYPTPPRGLKTKLLVQESLAPFVPKAWRRIAGTYRTVSLQSAVPETNGHIRLFLHGLMSDSYCSLEHQAKIIETLKTRSGGDLSKYEMQLFMPLRQGTPLSKPHQGFAAKYMMQLCRAFGTEFRVLEWEHLDGAASWKGCYVEDLNDGLLCVDSYIEHAVLSLGGCLAGADRVFNPQTNTLKPQESFVELSPYHGVITNSQIPDSTEVSELVGKHVRSSETYIKFYSAMRSPAYVGFPWPEWLIDWKRQQKN